MIFERIVEGIRSRHNFRRGHYVPAKISGCRGGIYCDILLVLSIQANCGFTEPCLSHSQPWFGEGRDRDAPQILSQ